MIPFPIFTHWRLLSVKWSIYETRNMRKHSGKFIKAAVLVSWLRKTLSYLTSFIPFILSSHRSKWNLHLHSHLCLLHLPEQVPFYGVVFSTLQPPLLTLINVRLFLFCNYYLKLKSFHNRVMVEPDPAMAVVHTWWQCYLRIPFIVIGLQESGRHKWCSGY